MDQPHSLESTHREGRIELAIKAIRSSQIDSLRKAARIYDIPLSTLSYRLCGRVARVDCQPNSQKLTNTKESVLIQQILAMDQRGTAPTAAIVREMANILLVERVKSTTTTPLTVGKN
jgi:hypothetical protein